MPSQDRGGLRPGLPGAAVVKILGGMVTKAQMKRIGEALAPIVG